MPVAEKHLSLLPRAIHSLKQQTYIPNLVIVNDSLIGIPHEVTLDYPRGLEIAMTEGNKGSAYCRNLGLDMVKTPLVTFLDADDWFLDNAIELLTRAYLEYDCCYVYGDWYQYGKSGTLSLHKAKPYDRQRQLRHSLHLVNILLETDVAKSVYYEINYRGWEDWEFHIRLGQKGFCGTRVPEPVVVYDMTTSINRDKHNAIQDEVYNEILDKYRDYLEGEKEFMPCQTCGGNKSRFQREFNAVPPEPQQGMTTLEYTGQNTGPINFTVGSGFNRKVYRGANDESFRYVNVPNEDVAELMSKGPWRKVVKASKPAQVPQPEEFNQWREINKTPVPENWEQLFKRDAVVITEETKEVTKEKPTTKRYVPKRHRRTKAEMLAARQAQEQ